MSKKRKNRLFHQRQEEEKDYSDMFKYDPKDYFYTGFISGLLAAGVSYAGLDEAFKADDKWLQDAILQLYESYQAQSGWATATTCQMCTFDYFRDMIDRIGRSPGYVTRKETV